MSTIFNVVTKIVKFIVARALNHRQFRDLISELDSDCGDLKLHNNVRWLSRGAVLQRFCECLPTIRAFLVEKDAAYKELDDTVWLCKLYFLADVTQHLNSLNVLLQGKGQLVSSLFEEVRVFQTKLSHFKKDIDNGKFTYFKTLKAYLQQNVDVLVPSECMLEVIQSLKGNFEQRFGSLTQHRAAFQFTTDPLTIESQEDISEALRWLCGDSFDEELLDLRERDLWKAKFFNLAKDLEHIYREKDRLSVAKQW